MGDREFEIEWRDGYAIFTLTRPDKLNTLTSVILTGLSDCLDEIEARRLRGLVIAGQGRAFCAGTDLAEAAALDQEAAADKVARARALFYRLHSARITSVAAIHGIAYGGGLELALACTFRVAGAAALLAVPEIRIGVLPAYAGTQLLPAIVGRAHALDLMLTGRSVSPAEALRMGLVSRAVDAGEELQAARDLAGEITGYSQVAIDGIRQCVAAAGPAVSPEGLALEAETFRRVSSSADAAEGVRAFLEKRPPRYRHR